MATSLRLPETLKISAAAYAATLGISLNALIAVALNDYLAARPSEPQPDKDGELEPALLYDPATKVIAWGSSISRNQLCPCGSRLKFKRCCGRTAPSAAPPLNPKPNKVPAS